MKMTGDYIAGLTDGEGCFYVNIHSPCYRYEVSNRDELKKLIKFFGKFPLHSPKKIKDFERIKKIFIIIDSKEHLKSKGINRISKLKLGMHS